MTSRFRLAVALFASLALAACGGSSGGSKASPSPTPKLLSVAEAKTAAAAAILTAADFPGYTVAAQKADPENDKSRAAFAACAGVTKATYIARDYGKAFTKGHLEIDSSADVTTTPAEAKAELGAFLSDKGVGCLKTELTKAVAKQGLTTTTVTVTPRPITVPGSEGAFAFEMSIDGTAGGAPFQLRGFEIGSLVGQVEIDVSVIASPTENVTLAQGIELITKATARAKAAS